MRYPVTLTPDDGSIVVTFPDVPEAITYGDTVEEALARAPDALMTIFDAFIKDKRDIPAPSAQRGQSIEIPALMAAKIELYRTMRDARVGKAELGRRLDWHLPQVDRLLTMRHGSQLDQLESAFKAMGKRLIIDVRDEVAGTDGTAAISRAAGRLLRKPRSHTTRVHGAVLTHEAQARRAERPSPARTALTRKAAKKR